MLSHGWNEHRAFELVTNAISAFMFSLNDLFLKTTISIALQQCGTIGLI